MPLPKSLADMLALPTAAFCETAVLTYLERACHALAGVTTRYDRYGNLLAHYRREPQAAVPFAFVGHTDHPGFVATEMLDRRTPAGRISRRRQAGVLPAGQGTVFGARGDGSKAA